MSAANVDVIRWGAERARAMPWRGDEGVAYLMPVPDAPVPSADFVRRCLDLLRARGFAQVITGALAPAEQAGFLRAGFEVHEHLHLLAHDLRSVAGPLSLPAGYSLRRARRADRSPVLRVDHAAFHRFWQLDDAGLDEALQATPRRRFRVAVGKRGRVVGYAITGRAGRRGFLQRLAVEPDHQGTGLGRALVVDALVWLRRWRVERAVVNTQVDNAAALALYERLGFRREPLGLSVLAAGLAR